MSQHYSIALLGAEGVGKTDLALRFTQNRYEEDYDPTIEDSYQKSFEVEGVAVRLDILDTAGQAEYQHYVQSYLSTREAFMLVFDVTSRPAYEQAVKLGEMISREKGETVPVLYVGNKVDLRGKAIAFQPPHLQARLRYSAYVETSAKENVNVFSAFSELVKLIWRRNSDKHRSIGFSEIIFEPVFEKLPESRKSKKNCPDCTLV